MQALCHGPTSSQGIIPSDWGGEEGLMDEEVDQRWGRRLTVLGEEVSGTGHLR